MFDIERQNESASEVNKKELKKSIIGKCLRREEGAGLDWNSDHDGIICKSAVNQRVWFESTKNGLEFIF